MKSLIQELSGKIKVGAAYYPETWDNTSIVDDDIAKMKYLGINIVRIGEFAWGTMEKEEGKFDFSFFRFVMDKMYEAGIGVVFCTPTPTPPKWLTDKYTESLRLNDNGMRKQFGARIHTCKSSPKFREKTEIIVKKICENLADHPALIGWQVDNEISPDYGCWCDYCKKGFQKFLGKRYGTIENLNKSWGNNRWSLSYRSFEDIIPPRSDTWNHFSLDLEWTRFHSSLNADFIHKQVEIIKKYSSLPVSTDMMPILDQNYYEMAEKLDMVQYNHYEPSDFLIYPSFWFDFIRPIKDKPFWVTETQVNWNGAGHPENGFRPKNNCYINTWLPIAKGGEVNMYWHWREHYAGHELYHGAVLSSSGRYCFNAMEVKHAIEDFKKVEDKLFANKIKSKIAMHFSTTSYLNFKEELALKKMNYIEFMYSRYHKAFRHYNVDLIDTPHSVDGYDVIISPFLSCVDENGLKERMIKFVEKGGTWIVGPFSDILKDNATKYQNAPYGFLEDFAGIYTEMQIPFANDVIKAKWKDGEELSIEKTFDAYSLKGAESLADYTESWPKGFCAIAEKKVGKGKVIVVGTVIGEKDLRKLVPIKPILNATDNVELIDRGELLIVIELENKQGSVSLDGKYKDLLTGDIFNGETIIEPFSVKVLERV